MPTLNWLTRKEDIVRAERVPYCALESAGAKVFGNPTAGNLLIQGDNLFALKSLVPHYAGRVKCIFIDPPYNTRKDFAHYADNLEHSQWLEMIYPRLELLRELLSADGSIWTIIDDDEGHYLKVIMDEIFTRRNFVANIVWQKKHTRANDARWFSDNHDHILVYAKNKENWQINHLPREEKQDRGFSNPDNDPRGPWASGPCHVKTPNEKDIFPVTTPSGRVYMPPQGTSWRFSKQKFHELIKDNRIHFGNKGSNVPRYKRFLSEVRQNIVPITLWLHADVGHNQDAKAEAKQFNSDEVFSTPKPEKLLMRVLQLATQPGDLVLDSFVGSGTTAAVAHKMGRRYIGIEMGDHAVTHCVPRLESVIKGEQGGVSKLVNWKGGGGFHFYRLGDSIFLPDGSVNPKINFRTLAAHLWFLETQTPYDGNGKSPLLGVGEKAAIALLYNGILKDKSANGGNILTRKTLGEIRQAAAKKGCADDFPIIIYANGSRLAKSTLDGEGVDCRQIPYEIKRR